MALPKHEEPETPEPPEGQEPAGRVEFDSRGNSVWRWARDVLDNTSILLKRLENEDLAIEPTQKVPIIPGGKADQAAKADKAEKKPARGRRGELSVATDAGGRDGGGFDPYNSRR